MTKMVNFDFTTVFQVVRRDELPPVRWRGWCHQNDSLWISHMVTPPPPPPSAGTYTSHHVAAGRFLSPTLRPPKETTGCGREWQNGGDGGGGGKEKSKTVGLKFIPSLYSKVINFSPSLQSGTTLPVKREKPVLQAGFSKYLCLDVNLWGATLGVGCEVTREDWP